MRCYQEIGVTYKTAWRMLQQIRLAMGNFEHKDFVDTIIEMDETYVGGKSRKKNDHGDKGDNSGNVGGNQDCRTGSKRGRGTSKTPVVGIIDRTNKRIYAKVATPNGEGKQLKYL